MTRQKRVNDPNILGTDPIFQGSWRLQVVSGSKFSCAGSGRTCNSWTALMPAGPHFRAIHLPANFCATTGAISACRLPDDGGMSH